MHDWKALLSSLVASDGIKEYNCGAQTHLFRQDGVCRFDAAALIHALDGKGFCLQNKNNVDGNFSYTFMDGAGVLLHVWYSPAEQCLRTVMDPFTKKLPPKLKQAEKRRCVKLWQFEIDHSLIDCGMCYIFQLEDGSFFLIDSAHFYSIQDDARIVSFLRARTPAEQPIHIRGWYFSHGHADHICKAADIIRYEKNVIIDAIYCNFIDLSLSQKYVWDPADLVFEKNFRALIQESGIAVYKLHTLQQVDFPGLSFTVLLTHEDVFPAPLDDYNNTSSVIAVQVGEDRILFPGDSSGEISPILEKRFSSALRCDILQQAHHGHFGLSASFYKMANAAVLFSPTTRIKYEEEFPRYAANQTAAALAKYVFVASDGTVEVTFPLREHSMRRFPDEIFENFEGINRLWQYAYTDVYKNELRERFQKRQSTEEFVFPKSDQSI